MYDYFETSKSFIITLSLTSYKSKYNSTIISLTKT